MDFRLNDADLVGDFEKNSAEIDVNDIKFKSYTLYEIAAKIEDSEIFKFVSYCTKMFALI